MRNLFLVLSLSALMVGCASRYNTPSASDTVLRSSYSDAMAAQSGDYIGATSINADTLQAQGLQTRDAAFDNLSDDSVAKNILPSIYFDFNKSSLSPEARAKLSQTADYLNAHPSVRVLLEGHCDWRGTAEYNLGLGERRAKSAQTYISTLGIDTDRLGTVSKGDLEAITEGTEQQMAQDRRVDVLILK